MKQPVSPPIMSRPPTSASTILLIRGVSGSGKSSLAARIMASQSSQQEGGVGGGIILNTDVFFHRESE